MRLLYTGQRRNIARCPSPSRVGEMLARVTAHLQTLAVKRSRNTTAAIERGETPAEAKGVAKAALARLAV